MSFNHLDYLLLSKLMKKIRESIDAGCNAIVKEFLRKATTKSRWITLEKMVADLEKFERSSVKDDLP